MLPSNQPAVGLNDMNNKSMLSVDHNCSGIVLVVLFEGQKAMIQPGQTTCVESAIFGNGILVLDWGFSSNHRSKKGFTQIRIP